MHEKPIKFFKKLYLILKITEYMGLGSAELSQFTRLESEVCLLGEGFFTFYFFIFTQFELFWVYFIDRKINTYVRISLIITL